MMHPTATNATAEMESEIMSEMNIASKQLLVLRRGRTLTLGVIVLSIAFWARLSVAQQAGPKTFSSAGEAAQSLFLAVRNEDEYAVEAILGAGKEVTSSNDDIEDKLERERFTQKYQEMHRMVLEADGKTVLYIGAENWPFPIPLVSKNGRWHFDSDAGAQEIVFRQIGVNETSAIEVCRAFAAARKRQSKSIDDDQINQYAQGLAVHPPKAGASLEKNSSPFHGYYFRTASEQQPYPGQQGSTYVLDTTKTSSVLLVAVPAEYGASGLMTFIVTSDGAVYQRNLGSNTANLAPAVLKEHNARSTWQAVR